MDERDNALLNTEEEKICCLCGREDEEAHRFGFHYGKSRGIKGASNVDPKAHDVKGAFEGYICHMCYLKGHLMGLLIGFILAAAILIGSWAFTILTMQQEYPFIITLIIVAIGFGTYQTFSTVRKYNKGKVDNLVIDDGAKLLLKKKGKAYMKQGYDSFWTPDQFRQMQEKLKPKHQPEETPKSEPEEKSK